MTSTIEAMQGHEAMVLQHFGLPGLTGTRHIDCPVCDGKKKFRLSEWQGKVAWICVCGSGSVMDLVLAVTGLDFASAAKEIDQLIGRVFKGDAPKPAGPSIEQRVVARFRQIQSLRGSPGEQYLNNRGIFTLPKRAVKYSGDEYEKESRRAFGALFSIATDDQGRPCYLHRTFLDGERKAGIDKAKKMLTINEAPGPVAIRLFDSGTALGVAEGIETALSAAQIFRAPTWATMNSSLMKRFRAPGGVEHLLVFADSDDSLAGHAAAFECAHRNMLAKNDVKRVTVRWPKIGDFNDVLTNGVEVYEWTATR